MLFMAKWEAVATIWLAVLVGFAGSFLVYKAVAGEAPQVTVAPSPAPAPKPNPAPLPAVVEEKPAAKVPGQPLNPVPAVPPVVAQPGKISDPADAGGLAIQRRTASGARSLLSSSRTDCGMITASYAILRMTLASVPLPVFSSSSTALKPTFAAYAMLPASPATATCG